MSYWSGKLGRRRFIASSAAAGLGAAFIAACGGGSDPGKREEAASSLLIKAADQTKGATRGGVFQDTLPNDTATWNPNLNGFGFPRNAGYVYSRFVQYKVGTTGKLPDGSYEPDFFQSYEQSADGMQITFKLRPDLKWDERAPTNSRLTDSEDVLYSWARFTGGNVRAGDFSNAKNPGSAVLSISAPDKQTAVMKLAFPDAGLMPNLGWTAAPILFPKEAEKDFDTRTVARGTGAWRLEEHQSSIAIQLARNPNWYNKERPFFDGWRFTIMSDYAQGVAQLKAGNLDTYAVRQEDVLALRQEAPNLLMYERPNWQLHSGGHIYFGLQSGSPFSDDRVRRAMSMEIDRSTWLDAFSNKEKFGQGGINVDLVWNNFVPAGQPFWLDPQGKEIGEGGKNFKFDPAEAKKLLSAAGVKTPLSLNFYLAGPLAPTNAPLIEAVRGGIASQGDFTLDPKILDTVREYSPQIETVRGEFKGVAHLAQADHPDFGKTMNTWWNKDAIAFWMKDEDPKIRDFLNAQRAEFDRTKRANVFKEFQKYAATKMYYIPGYPGDWKTFSLAQKWIANYNYHVAFTSGNSQQEDRINWWLDKSKKA